MRCAISKSLTRNVLLGLLWLGVVGTGLIALAKYEQAPGPMGASPTTWPVASALSPPGGHWRLLMFAHPRCPCTRASFRQLETLLTHCQNAQGKSLITPTVVFILDDYVDPTAPPTELMRTVAGMPGVVMSEDPGGHEAALFGVETSGHVLLYDPAGQLAFSGGITPQRGHDGDNLGRAAIEALVHDQQAPATTTPVYGCRLH